MSKFSKNYPFLDHIWNLYDEFNKPVVSHLKKSDMISICEEHATYENEGKETYNDLCMKLLRNLLLLTKYSNDIDIYSKRCNDLYNWLYHEMKPYNPPENIVPNIFDRSNSLMQGTDKKNLCLYSSYNKDEYKDEKIIELNIFGDNIEKLLDILKNRSHSHYCPCIKYVKNCVETYKNLNKKYCTDTKEQTRDKVKFCNKLNKFTTYYGYLTDVSSIISEIPSLSLDTYTNECLSDKTISQSSSSTGKSLGNSTSVAASTVVGAMVGIPPFLTLMYKFTPVGQLFCSRNYKGIANNIGENELFYPTNENMNNSSDHTKYNVLYGSVRN
ncbi:VIR protein [Plasmodium vivax]|uniref:VIR protein n=1 Tax=Plasmodium vivax TaxID=5855 RepID=A0A1G4EEF2_PLAVI|nr:VIR protein [Plasmodium vivax]